MAEESDLKIGHDLDHTAESVRATSRSTVANPPDRYGFGQIPTVSGSRGRERDQVMDVSKKGIDDSPHGTTQDGSVGSGTNRSQSTTGSRKAVLIARRELARIDLELAEIDYADRSTRHESGGQRSSSPTMRAEVMAEASVEVSPGHEHDEGYARADGQQLEPG